MYTTSQLATLFRTTDQSIKRYAKEFAAYLSPTATPEKGGTRLFTDDDLTVYALIVSLSANHQTYEQIHLALSRGDRVEPPDTDPDTLAVAPNPVQLRLMAQIENLQSEVERLKPFETKSELLAEQLREAQAEIKALNREIGRLEAKGS